MSVIQSLTYILQMGEPSFCVDVHHIYRESEDPPFALIAATVKRFLESFTGDAGRPNLYCLVATWEGQV